MSHAAGLIPEMLAGRWRAADSVGEATASRWRYKSLDLRNPKLRVTTVVDIAAPLAIVWAEAMSLFVTLEAGQRVSSTNAPAPFPGYDTELVRRPTVPTTLDFVRAATPDPGRPT